MIKVETEIVVNRPKNERFDLVANPENNLNWQSGMISAEIVSGLPVGVGSIYKQEAQFLGRKIASTFEIVEYEAGQVIKGQSVARTFPIVFTRIVEDHPKGTLVRALVEGDASVIFRLAAPLMGKWMIGQFEAIMLVSSAS